MVNLQALSISEFIPKETTTLFQYLIQLPPDRLSKLKSLSLAFWFHSADSPCVKLGTSLIPLLPRLALDSLSLKGADLAGFEFPDEYRLELKRIVWVNCELKDEAMVMINSSKDSLESLTLRFDNYSASTLFSPLTTFASLHSLPHLTYLLLQDVKSDSMEVGEMKAGNANLSERLEELFRVCSSLRWLKMGITPRLAEMGITPRPAAQSSTRINFHLELLPESLVHLEFSLDGGLAVAPRVSDVVSWIEGGGTAGLRTLIAPEWEGMKELEQICYSRKINLTVQKTD